MGVNGYNFTPAFRRCPKKYFIRLCSDYATELNCCISQVRVESKGYNIIRCTGQSSDGA